jgi:WD40 domain-containing protein
MATQIATIDAGGPSGGYVEALALAPNAGLAVTGSRSGQILVWSTTAGETFPEALSNHRESIADLAFSPDGRVLASLGRARENAVRLWRFDDRAGSGEWVEAASVPVGRCLALRFDGTGARLAVLCETEVLVVDVASQQVMSRLANQHKEALTAFDLSADGQCLVTAGHDGEITVRDAVTEATIRSFNVRRSRRPYPPPRGLEPSEVWGVVVALSGDGSRATAVTIEGTVYVWDVATGKQLFDHADGEAGGPPPGSLRFGRRGLAHDDGRSLRHATHRRVGRGVARRGLGAEGLPDRGHHGRRDGLRGDHVVDGRSTADLRRRGLAAHDGHQRCQELNARSQASKSPVTTRLPAGLRPTAFASGWRPDSSSTPVAVTGGDCGASEQAARPSVRTTTRPAHQEL